jgi:hypothetical protein
MADGCVGVGKVVFDAAGGPYKATYNPSSFTVSCMHDILPASEVRKLTNNPAATDAALKKYYALAAKSGHPGAK